MQSDKKVEAVERLMVLWKVSSRDKSILLKEVGVDRLLEMHACLRIAYPRNYEIVYGWINCNNKILHGTPIEMLKRGEYQSVLELLRSMSSS